MKKREIEMAIKLTSGGGWKELAEIINELLTRIKKLEKTIREEL